MPSFRFTTFAWLRALAFFLLLPVVVSAQDGGYVTSPLCANAFPLSNGTFPSPPVVLVPAQVRSDEQATVCVLDFVYVDRVAVTVDHQHVLMTLYDNGFSWSPNPPIVVSGQLPRLPAGTYSLDVVVDAGYPFQGSGYPYAVVTDFPFTVTGSVAATPIPALSNWGMAAALLLIACAAGFRLSRAGE